MTTTNPAPVTTCDAERAALLEDAAEIAMAGWHSVEKARAFACAVSDYLSALPLDFKQATDQGGWQLVPKTPTALMLTTLWNRKDVDSPAQLEDAYRATLAAAPTLQGVADGDAA